MVSECKCPKLLNTYFIKPGNQELIDFALSSFTDPYLLYTDLEGLNPFFQIMKYFSSAGTDNETYYFWTQMCH